VEEARNRYKIISLKYNENMVFDDVRIINGQKFLDRAPAKQYSLVGGRKSHVV